MLDETTQLLIASKGNTPLTFITGLKYDTNVVKALNNLTFLYDPNWEYEAGNPTYPVAFFYVKKQSEEMVAEVSQKPLLFYNSESNDGTDSVKAGLMNIVADNIIIKPKVYKLDVVIPMNMNHFFDGGYFNPDLVANVNSFMFTGNTLGNNGQGARALQYVLNIATKTRSILKTLVTALYGTELSASSIVTMLCSQQDYNKNSIEYMWRNRRVIKLKMWTGWNFKYLVITNFDVTKEGTTGDFFEGTITCQELPVITLRNSGQTKKVSTITQLLGGTMKTVTESFVSAMEATYGDGEATT